MSGFVGVIVSDPWLQSQFTQVELRTLKSKFASKRTQSGHVTVVDLPPLFVNLRAFTEMFNEDDIKVMLEESGMNMEEELDFEAFLRTYLNLRSRATKKTGGKKLKSSVSFLKVATTTFHHNINESEKASYVAHINNYLGEDPFLKKYLPIDPATNAIFDLVKDGVLLCKLINVAVPGTIDERAINTKGALNPWERNENHTLCLNSVKDGEAYAYLLNALAPEHSSHGSLNIKDPTERANMVIEQAEKLDCKRYLTPTDIVEGSPNLNLAFVAQIFQHRRVLLEVLDKVSPGSVNWKQASKPPIKMPFRKVENCNQVIKIGKDLCFSLVNVAGNDIVQGNKKLILAYLWQLMRFTMLELLENLRSHSSHSQGKEITDSDILNWANNKVKKAGRTSQMESFKDKNVSNGIFFLELLSAVEPRVVNWSVVTKGETDEDQKLNATYIISVARKLGCSIFLLPEDIIEVNQKMILILTASIMYWSLQQQSESESFAAEDSDVPDASPAASADGENEAVLVTEVSNLAMDDAVSDSTVSIHVDKPSSSVEEKEI